MPCVSSGSWPGAASEMMCYVESSNVNQAAPCPCSPCAHLCSQKKLCNKFTLLCALPAVASPPAPHSCLSEPCTWYSFWIFARRGPRHDKYPPPPLPRHRNAQEDESERPSGIDSTAAQLANSKIIGHSDKVCASRWLVLSMCVSTLWPLHTPRPAPLPRTPLDSDTPPLSHCAFALSCVSSPWLAGCAPDGRLLPRGRAAHLRARRAVRRG